MQAAEKIPGGTEKQPLGRKPVLNSNYLRGPEEPRFHGVDNFLAFFRSRLQIFFSFHT